MPRLVLLAAFLSVFALAAHAGEKGGAPGTNVEMPFLMAPVCNDGKLIGYAYISSKVVTNSSAASLRVRGKIPFIQDLFVRDVNARPITKAGEPGQVDQDALVARLTSDVKRVVGAQKIATVMILKVQITELHPREALVAAPLN